MVSSTLWYHINYDLWQIGNGFTHIIETYSQLRVLSLDSHDGPMMTMGIQRAPINKEPPRTSGNLSLSIGL